MRQITWMKPAAAGLALALAACGGDDGDGGGGGTPNTPPTFTSAATASVAENAAGTVYTATASDAESNPLTFSIAGGADAALFQITAGGALSFRTAPDFETPGDADRNNVYQVQLSVSDGSASATLSLQITVTDVAGTGFSVQRVATGFAAPVFLTALAGTSNVLVVERGGQIRVLNPANGGIQATPFLDITGQVSTDGERGLLSIALAPDYAASGRAYVFLTATDGALEVRRYTASADRLTLDAATGDVILRIAHPRNNHNGGWLGFGRDGFLYVATGDGGGANDPDGNGQNTATLLGKMLRLDVSRDGFPADANRDYGIPATNPFATAGGAPEVWLYGLRNPFRNSFDRATGDLWIADVGQGAVEEINRVSITAGATNYGWPRYEGTQALLGGGAAGLTMPVAEYGHGGGPLQGNSITGGYVYRGPAEGLQGLYVFADFVSNNVWTVPIAGLTVGTTASSAAFTNRNAAFAPNVGTLSGITSFGEDQAGNLYIVTIGGSVFVIRPA